jgi:hypothetical protein
MTDGSSQVGTDQTVYEYVNEYEYGGMRMKDED